MRLLLLLALSCAPLACRDALGDDDEPRAATAPDDDRRGRGEDPACGSETCGAPEARTILFPGDPACDGGCERRLAGDDIYVPPRSGRPWGDTYRLGTGEPTVLAGYSSGRVALLRRMALVDDGRHAVLLDPLWPDGERDFLGRGPERGEEIVRAWLRRDPRRTFLLVYSRSSGGWAPYAQLRESDVGARVTVCAVDEPHLRVPAAEGIRDALLDPAGWDNGACKRGEPQRISTSGRPRAPAQDRARS